MKWKLILILILCVSLFSACSDAQFSSQPTALPTATRTTSPTHTPSSTPTPTETPTPTPTPEGEQLTSPMVRFSIFVPSGFETITGIYRYEYAYAAAYQGEEYWDKAIIFLDMDVSEEMDLPLEIFLLLALENLDYFNVTVEDMGAAVEIDTKFPGSQAIDFTGSTKDVSIQGQIIGFELDDDHILIALSWSDISADPDAWNNEGVFLFHFALDQLVIEE